jgi:integrase
VQGSRPWRPTSKFLVSALKRPKKQGGPLAPASVRQVHAIIRRALAQGVKWGWLTNNPAARATPPRVLRPQLDAPEPEDVVRLIEQAREDDPDLAVLLHLAVVTGARRGELCGLRWRHADLEGGTLEISRSIVLDEHGILVEKDTKTHARRRVALDPRTIEVLRVHRVRMAERALAVGARINDTCFLFSPSADLRRCWDPNEITKDYIALRKRAGVTGVRLHDRREVPAGGQRISSSINLGQRGGEHNTAEETRHSRERMAPLTRSTVISTSSPSRAMSPRTTTVDDVTLTSSKPSGTRRSAVHRTEPSAPRATASEYPASKIISSSKTDCTSRIGRIGATRNVSGSSPGTRYPTPPATTSSVAGSGVETSKLDASAAPKKSPCHDEPASETTEISTTGASRGVPSAAKVNDAPSPPVRAPSTTLYRAGKIITFSVTQSPGPHRPSVLRPYGRSLDLHPSRDERLG